MIILGIDPGTRITGYGLIEAQGNRCRHVDNGCIAPRATDPMSERLLFIAQHVEKLIKQFQPDLVSAHSTKAGFAARIHCALLGFKPVLFTAHGWAFTEGRGSRARSWHAMAERLAAKVTTRIICVSRHDQDLAGGQGVRRLMHHPPAGRVGRVAAGEGRPSPLVPRDPPEGGGEKSRRK